MSVYQTHLVLEKWFGGVDFSYLSYFDSGWNSNLASYDMEGLWFQGMDVDDYNYPSPKNIPYEVLQPLNAYNCKYYVIIFPGWFNNLHNTKIDFKIYSLG